MPKFGKKDIIKGAKSNRGSLKEKLGVKKKDKIPMGLLNAVIKAKAGDTISNPTQVGKKKIKVTYSR